MTHVSPLENQGFIIKNIVIDKSMDVATGGVEAGVVNLFDF